MARKSTLLTFEALSEFTAPHDAPCLSLYQPTHRSHPENQQDPIRFRNLVRELENVLKQSYPESEIQQILAPFEDLAQDSEFWQHTGDGLAVLGAQNLFRVYLLQRPVAELAVAADSFHTSPLRRYLQTAGRYQILGFDLHCYKLYEGNRNAIDEIDRLPDVPRTREAALGERSTESSQTVASYGGVGHGTAPMHHDSDQRQSKEEADDMRFLHLIDQAVLEDFSRPSGLPLILAALPEHQALFRAISDNPQLLEIGVSVHPDSVTTNSLCELAWAAAEPQYQAKLTVLTEQFAEAKGHERGTDNAAQAALAAVAGRVATLLLETDRWITGRIDPATGAVGNADQSGSGMADLLDDLGELVAAKGGSVVMMPKELMPCDSGVAAIYRY